MGSYPCRAGTDRRIRPQIIDRVSVPSVLLVTQTDARLPQSNGNQHFDAVQLILLDFQVLADFFFRDLTGQKEAHDELILFLQVGTVVPDTLDALPVILSSLVVHSQKSL